MKKPKSKYPRQLSFDDFLPKADDTDKIEGKVTYNHVHVNQSTFKAGLATRIHRWFRLTPSFGPDLVQKMLTELNCDLQDVVLDPFAGAGTSMIECQLEGIASYGFEINPFLHFVAQTSLNWELDTSRLKKDLDTICEEFHRMDPVISSENIADYNLEIPKIYNPTRWWRPDVLKRILILKSCINTFSYNEPARNLLNLALAGVLVPDLTNVTLGRLQLHFIDRSNDDIQVLNTFVSHALDMIDDLCYIKQLGLCRKSRVFLADSTNIGDLAPEEPVRCVITSPPYPNRYSYVWNTRPHLYLFGFLSTARQASDLDKRTVGGTWGTATSILSKGVLKGKYPIIDEVVSPVVNSIRQNDNLMANYAMKYFNLLAKQIVEMDKLLTQDVRIAYVVGCSRLKGVYVETDVILGKIIEGLGLGYKVSDIQRIRRRHSGKNLHESIVYARKQ